MANVSTIYLELIKDLNAEAKLSKHKVDADEKDPRYKCYGVRKPQQDIIYKKHKKEIASLNTKDKLLLINKLVQSEMGEEQSLSFYIMDMVIEFYTPDKFHILDNYLEHFYGWSKIDGFAGWFMQKVLLRYPKETLPLVKKWNRSDNLWARRASVVIFTRKIGASNKFCNEALKMCENLIWDKEDMVQKGVGWCLKDILRGDKNKVLKYIKELRKKKVPSKITLYALRDIKGEEKKEILKIK